jgi:hypothetical protein
MIIQTRYRDVDWEETGCPTETNSAGLMEWARCRGTPISIETPSTMVMPYSDSQKWKISSTCNQPKYRVVGCDGIAVCCHIAEIGD